MLITALGVVGLGTTMAILPILGNGDVNLAQHTLAFAAVALCVSALLYGLITLAVNLLAPILLFEGGVSGTLGVLTAYLGGRPEAPPPYRSRSCSWRISSG